MGVHPHRSRADQFCAARGRNHCAAGGEGAKPIVEKLDDAALAKVASALENLSMLTRDELIEIVMDFIAGLRKTNGALCAVAGRVRRKSCPVSWTHSRLSLVFKRRQPRSDSRRG
jgi:flagellar motor switch protein FliG